MSPNQKKIGIVVLSVFCALAVAVLLLINYANRILKHEIERAMGKDLTVQRIVLNWGSVDAYGLKLTRGGELIAEVEKVGIRANFLGLIRKQYSLSELVVERPVLMVRINKEGEVENPFARPGEEGKKPSAPMPAFEIKEIVIEKGLLRLRDERLPPGQEMVEVRDLGLRLNNLLFPFRDSTSKIKVSAAIQSAIASGSVSGGGGLNLKTHAFNLDMDVSNFILPQKKGGEPAAAAERIILKASSGGGDSNRFVISELALSRPYLRVEVDRAGKVVSPFPVSREGSQTSPKKPAAAIDLKKISVTGGSLLYLDGKVSSPPHPTRLDSIEVNITDISLPFGNNWTNYSLSARIPGRGSNGSFKWTGKTNFKTVDTQSNIALRGLDITGFKPYFQKKADADVTRGTLDISMTATVRSRMIHAPGTAVLKNLEFRTGRGVGDKFIGVPRSLVLDLLKTSNNEIPLDFTLQGSIDDPKFNITEGLTKRFTVGLANKLGLSVVEAGETVIVQGVKGVKEVGKGIKGLGESLQKVFKK